MSARTERQRGYTVYYGANEDGYPTSKSFGRDERVQAEGFYEGHRSFGAVLVAHTTLRECSGGNPYAGVPPTERVFTEEPNV